MIIIRILTFGILSYFIYKQTGWLIPIVLAWLYFSQESSYLTTTLEKLTKALPNTYIAQEDIDALEFSDDSLTLDEMILMQHTTEGDLEALCELLERRCLDKEFDFGRVPVELLDDLAVKVTYDVVEKYGGVTKEDGDDDTFFDQPQDIR